jgi:outer membrane receptor for ferrienterochelin and colicins
MRSWVLVFCLAVGPVHAARAQDAGAVDLAAEASLHFERAIELYRDKDYRGALERLLLSNRLAPNRNVAFNIARVYEKLDDPQTAWRYYAAFVAEEPDQGRRQPAEEALARLAGQVALVRIESEPPGATVYIDRKDLGARGRTPITLALDPSVHEVILERAGFVVAQGSIEAVVGETKEQRVALEPVVGTVELRGTPEGASVYDVGRGALVGTLPLRVDVPAGPMTVRVEAPGHASRELVVEVLADESRVASVALERLMGRVVVDAPDSGALVQVDGLASGFTPVVLDLPVGPHDIVVSLEGTRPYTTTVDVVQDRDNEVSAVLASVTEASAASRVLQDVSDAPASVTVLTARDLRAFGWQTVAAALEGLRGVYVSDDLSYTTLGVRGFLRAGDYGNRVLVAMDGHTMNDDQSGASYIAEDLMVDLHDVQRVELLRGPGSALYGTNAVLGVVNVVTHDQGAASRPHGSISVDERRTARARVGYGGDNGEVGGWISASGLLSAGGDPRFPELASEQRPGGLVEDADQSKAWSVRGKLWWKDLTVQAHFNARDKRIPTGAFETIVADPRARNRDMRGFFEVRWEPQLHEVVKFAGRVYADGYHYAGDFPYDDGALVQDRWTGFWLGVEPRVLITPVDLLDVTVGAEFRSSLSERLTGGDEAANWLDQQVSQQVVSAYALVDVKPVRWFRASLGGRYDYFTLDGVGGAFNPRGSLIFQPTDADVVKLLVGTAFRAPSAYERFYNDGGTTQVVSEALDPERVLTAEAEYSHRFGSVVTLSVGGFYNRLSRLIDLGDVPGGSGLFRFENTDSLIHSVGAEAELSRAWRRGWTSALQVSWQRTRVGDLLDGEALTDSPEWMVGGRLAAPVVPRVLTAATRVVLDSPRRTQAGTSTPWGLLWDINLSAEIPNQPIGLSLGVRNLADWKRVNPAGPDLLMSQVPRAGRSFFAELRVNM